MTENDLSIFGADIAAFFRARDAVKRAKKDLNEADANYEKAKADFKDLQSNFLAACESSEEPKNWTAANWIAVTFDKSIWDMILIELN